MARVDENGEPIDMQNMPARPHRRRREKKLMTMDEVNEKFPMVKYKTWVLERRRDGLPTAGGISVSPSRANSIRSVRGAVPEQPDGTRQSSDEQTRNADLTPEVAEQRQGRTADKETEPNQTTKTTDVAEPGRDATSDKPAVPPPVQVEDAAGKDVHRSSEDDEEEEDDHVGAGMDPDMVGSSGDTCAICIDTLEDNDDVRGLTCGHAFHAVCLDPWLTNRRACCPLCKADYYTPKARPQPAEGENQDPNAPGGAGDPSRNNNRMNYPRAPARSFAWSHFRDAPRQMFPSRFDGGSQPAGASRSRPRPDRPGRHNATSHAQAAASQDGNRGNILMRFRNQFPPFRLDQMMRRNQNRAPASNEPLARTPSQLEAAVRPSNT